MKNSSIGIFDLNRKLLPCRKQNKESFVKKFRKFRNHKTCDELDHDNVVDEYHIINYESKSPGHPFPACKYAHGVEPGFKCGFLFFSQPILKKKSGYKNK